VLLYSRPCLEKSLEAAKANKGEVVCRRNLRCGVFDVGFPMYNRTHLVASLEDASRVFELPETG